MKHTENGFELDPCSFSEIFETGKWCKKDKCYVSNVSCYHCQLKHDHESGLEKFIRLEQEKKLVKK